MKLTRWLGPVLLAVVTGACSGTSGHTTVQGVPLTRTTSSAAPSTPSDTTPTGSASSSASSEPSSTPPAPSSPATGRPTPPPSPAGAASRVAELGSQGGFVANGQLLLKAPRLVVYSDGTAVLDAAKRFTVKPADLSALLAALRKDLAGQPATLRPPRPMPDAADTVLGVRQADGTYQRLTANALPTLGPNGAYPAVVYDAYTRLLGLTQSPDALGAGPFASDHLRLAYLCPSTSANPAKPWPSGLPQPTNPAGGNCSETHVVAGAAVGVARSACQATTSALPSVAYQSDKGLRTCQWRSALPDETQ